MTCRYFNDILLRDLNDILSKGPCRYLKEIFLYNDTQIS